MEQGMDRKMDGSVEDRRERRHFPRYPFVAYAEVTDLKVPDALIKARTSDLAREGCYVDTITPFEVGTNVLVKITRNEETLAVEGRVFYSCARLGMGVHFTSVQAAETAVIERWIAEFCGETTIEGDPNDTQNLIGQLETILDKLSKKRLY